MGLTSVPDVRVAPLVQTKWSQHSVCGNYCYNYYTPNHYYCGCVATAMAQLMRYHQYPDTGIGVHYFMIEVNGYPRTVSTRGGDGYGGVYNWSDMVLVPSCSTTSTQRKAIGALCYDAGISVHTDYTPDGSGAPIFDVKPALTTTFKYDNAVNGYNDEENIGPGLIGMINPNLDYGSPVILAIWNDESGHAIVCDGYGYAAPATLYHHLNMGWQGTDDAWYNLPTILDFDIVDTCIYNIFVDGTGEIISGRVTNALGDPISGATVTATGSVDPYSTTTNANGIYALAKIPSASTYTISVTKTGYLFTDQIVTTGTSYDESNTSGNKWEIDFMGVICGDFDGDSDVDATDFVMLASAWLTEPGDAGWNPDCDISIPADNFIDVLDLDVFVDNWLMNIE